MEKFQTGGTSWACNISRKRMTLDKSPVDRPILSFVKL